MKFAFYAPFKPIGHKTPSGDLIIARSIFKFLGSQNHEVVVPSRLRARWIYFKPWLWIWALADVFRILKQFYTDRPHAWITYHTYYKAPDIIGPLVCRLLGLKYIIFQGIYSTKRRRRFKTVFGFYLNRLALKQADHVFTNKGADLKNLARIIPSRKLSYIRPGIHPLDFKQDRTKGAAFKKKWNFPDCPIVLTAAMFRDDVKTRGLTWLIKCLSRVSDKDIGFHLVIAGSGKMEKQLMAIAETSIPGQHTFVGKVNRENMDEFYNSGDIFAFPGIRESLGMVYLEAQSCGLPVVAFDNGGIPEVVKNGETGFLVPMYDENAFAKTLIRLITQPYMSRDTGMRATKYVTGEHDIDMNYKKFLKILVRVVST